MGAAGVICFIAPGDILHLLILLLNAPPDPPQPPRQPLGRRAHPRVEAVQLGRDGLRAVLGGRRPLRPRAVEAGVVVLEGLAVVLALEREYLDRRGGRQGTGQSEEIDRDREREMR